MDGSRTVRPGVGMSLQGSGRPEGVEWDSTRPRDRSSVDASERQRRNPCKENPCKPAAEVIKETRHPRRVSIINPGGNVHELHGLARDPDLASGMPKCRCLTQEKSEKSSPDVRGATFASGMQIEDASRMREANATAQGSLATRQASGMQKWLCLTQEKSEKSSPDVRGATFASGMRRRI